MISCATGLEFFRTINGFNKGASGAVTYDAWLPHGTYRAVYQPASSCPGNETVGYATLVPAALPRWEGLIETCIETVP